MRLAKRNISERDGEGSVQLTCDIDEDMWHSYNLIAVGDELSAPTFRKVVKEGASGTKSEKVRTTLTIRVEDVAFEPEECVLRVKGVTCKINKHVKLGAYHTLELEKHRAFTLHKDVWDSVYLTRLEDACNVEKGADVAAVVLGQGVGHVMLITGHMTIVKTSVEVRIPKKRAGFSGHDKAWARLYELVYGGIVKHLDWGIVKSVLVGSAGFVAEEFHKWMLAEATRRGDRQIIENKSKFVLVHVSSTGPRAVREMLSDPGIARRLAGSKATEDVALLESFMGMMRDDSERAWYGLKQVEFAAQHGAVEHLMVVDDMFQGKDVGTRQRYIRIMDDVLAAGGKTHVFSRMHVSGEQLAQISGIAATLRFPLPDLEDIDLDSDSEDEDAFGSGGGGGGR
jgi:protein pelota